MQIKLIEVRDRGTFIPCIAISMDRIGATHEEEYLLRRAGYSLQTPEEGGCVLFGRLDGGDKFQYAPYNWSGEARTMREAHNWIEANWSSIASGDVVDVEFALGETSQAKESERVTA